MALFTVNRFLGDSSDSDVERENSAKDPANILAQLQAQAEKRKREKEEQDGCQKKKSDRIQETHEPRLNKKVKKKKRKKSCDNDSVNEDIIEESIDKKSKKKKKLSKSEKSEIDNDAISNDEKGENISSPKKGDRPKTPKDKQSHESNVKKKKHKKDVENNEHVAKAENDAVEMETEDVDENAGPMVQVQEGGQEIGGFTVLGDFKKKNKEQVRRVLPEWLASPSVISADLRNKRLPVGDLDDLDSHLIEKLKENGITHFFPVQMQVIPELLSVTKYGSLVGRGGYRPQDVCVSAPTGSGKTLAFVLPVVQALRERVVCQLRAVVVLPVKDLATQVFRVFQTYTTGTSLKVFRAISIPKMIPSKNLKPIQVGLAVGQTSLAVEQQNLVGKRLRGPVSLVDILVATPGRLVDHITQTDGLDLSHLRFLVIDEADRMMDDIKQDWLTSLESAVYHPHHQRPDTSHRDVPGPITVANCSRIQTPLQKLLFSATLSQNPETLQHLNLFQPRLFTSVVKVTATEEKLIGRALTGGGDDNTATAGKKSDNKGEFIGKYTTPLGLTEYMVRVTASEKPLVVLHLLHNLHFHNILCFTNSREATHRLCLMVRLFGDIVVEEFSSNLPVQKRNKIIRRFSAGKIDLLICSDAMARGMDVDNVKYVISYDATHNIKTYIHRIGRTARAGKVGTAITLLENKEVQHFKSIVQEAGKTDVQEMNIDKMALSPLVPRFQEALKQLPQLLMDEKMKKKLKG